MLKKEYITKSVSETQKLAAKFAQNLKRGEIIALSGDLGGGKTTFTQGLAKVLGIKNKITSPTFVLIKEYKINLKHSNLCLKSQNLVHIDLYRLKKIDPIFKKELKEYFNSQNICIIEWAKKIKGILPSKTKWIKFEFVNENSRQIIFC